MYFLCNSAKKVPKKAPAKKNAPRSGPSHGRRFLAGWASSRGLQYFIAPALFFALICCAHRGCTFSAAAQRKYHCILYSEGSIIPGIIFIVASGVKNPRDCIQGFLQFHLDDVDCIYGGIFHFPPLL